PLGVLANQATVVPRGTIRGGQEDPRAPRVVCAVDWGARASATVGGAVNTNAGGSRVVRFGTMRAQVVGLEAVLADG
ncbi:MAG TPA: FAD-binding oxidoreductase, partial [Acidimicrobiaceae bacterium]|nr:FAD-binding oxidoreductase [Acidimicrobiaceae bacterium]